MNGRNPRATNSLSTNVISIGACPKATFTHTVHERPNRAPQSHHFGLAASPQISEDAARPKTKSAWRCQFRPGGKSPFYQIQMRAKKQFWRENSLRIFTAPAITSLTLLWYMWDEPIWHMFTKIHNILRDLYGLYANAMETCTSTKACCGGSIVSIQRP